MRDIINVNRAITLWPEWAYAVLHLKKDVENRPWTIAPGVYALHAGVAIGGRRSASARRDGIAALRATVARVFTGNASPLDEMDDAALISRVEALCGAVVGVVEVMPTDPDPPGNKWRPSWSLWTSDHAIDPGARSEYEHKPTIANPIELRHVAAAPIPCRGQLGLWRLPTEIASVVTAWPMEPV